MIIQLKKQTYYLLLIFFVFTLLFPVLIINKIFFLLIIILFLFNYNSVKLNTLSPLYIFLIFTYGFIVSMFNNVDKVLSLQFFLSILVLILIYPITYYKIDLDMIIKKSGLILSLYSLISFIIIVVFIDSSVSEQYYLFFRDYSSGSNGLREFTEEGMISFHAGTAPFLFLPLILYFESFLLKKNFLKLSIIILHLFVILISGSRGTFFTSILAIFLIIFYTSKPKNKLFLIFSFIPLLSFFLYELINNTQIFSSGEGSNNIKLGHLLSFFDNVNFFNFIFGNGLASYYFSKGTGTYLAHTEITPLDMIRYLGFIFSIILYTVIIFPTRELKFYFGDKMLYVILFLIYVINSFTNPTMFNSYGLLVVLWYWYKILGNKNDNSLQSNLSI